MILLKEAEDSGVESRLMRRISNGLVMPSLNHLREQEIHIDIDEGRSRIHLQVVRKLQFYVRFTHIETRLEIGQLSSY